jgi:hypothetical protein
MSAERLAVWDLVRCSRCRKWHAAEIWASGSRGPHIIATSRIPVFPLVTQGIFRADLYYRLHAIHLSASTYND